ncbi:hypothetical protein Tco_0935125 [Tanacetum coccineum]
MEVHLRRLQPIQKDSRPGISRLAMSSRKPVHIVHGLHGDIAIHGSRDVQATIRYVPYRLKSFVHSPHWLNSIYTRLKIEMEQFHSD